MLATSRLANTVRAAMPYARWVTYLVQLGYLGYISYQMYQDYRAQLETDARNGCNRSPEEAIELVMTKPQRKRNRDAVERSSSSDASTSIESPDSNNGIINDFYTECFICAESLNDPRKTVATLPFCMHPFHQKCLDGVLKWHPKCPVCGIHIFSSI